MSKTSSKILYREKKLGIHLLVTHCLQIFHLMQQKTNFIVTEGQICKDLRQHAMKIIKL